MARAAATDIVAQFRVASLATAEATQRALVTTAKREHAYIMAATPQPRSFTRRVDGRLGAVEETVKPDGIIVYDYPRVAEIVQAAMDLLFDLSPVDSGDYRISHQIFVDGAAVPNLKDWDGQGDVTIVNFVPYSRKIELGKMTMRVPGTDHVYEQAEYLLNRRYGNVAAITFIFQGIIGGSAVRGKVGNKSDNRYPALRIRSR